MAMEGANEECVGPSSEAAGKASTCDGCPNQKACAEGAGRQEDPELELIRARLQHVQRKVLILSGKGGVGKSTLAAQLAFALAARGLRVGLLDVDICGPSIPLMLGLKGQTVHQSGSGWSPVYVTGEGLCDDEEDEVELGVMSIGFMLPNDDDAVIWRGPRKNGLIKQFLTDVEWGALDYLIVDTPPGTSDEHISLVQYLAKALGPHDGALVVSTPQEVSLIDVRKELSFCAKTKLRVLGVVENMAEYATPLHTLGFRDAAGADVTSATIEMLRAQCPQVLELIATADIFPRASGGAEEMARKFGVPFLGRVPLDPSITIACEQGSSYAASARRLGRNNLLQPLVDGLLASAPKAED
ncbi:hypothetical protein AB1Y20_011877 [Prymnesium parvum]|uniref:Cytosolic Fe-S cluster assembly factor NUBP1 homolog n=1 Tax=Prymnesium parvum TaxID=97485 RepID=A0AB34IHS5_PRYPA